MNLMELRKKVEDTIAAHPNAMTDGVGDMMTLELSSKRNYKALWIRLFGRHGGPYARVMDDTQEGRIVVMVSARRVRDWLKDHGMWEAGR